MRPFASFIAFSLLLLTPAAAPAAVDGIEELLSVETSVESSEKAITADSPIKTLLDSEFVPTAPSSELNASWRSEVSSRSTSSSGVAAHADTAQSADRTDETEPVSYVPEPSTMLLCAAALIYFLLFGRRRNLA